MDIFYRLLVGYIVGLAFFSFFFNLMSTTNIHDQMLIIYQSHAHEEYKISELFFFLAFSQFMTALSISSFSVYCKR